MIKMGIFLVLASSSNLTVHSLICCRLPVKPDKSGSAIDCILSTTTKSGATSLIA